jgi:hypothetical protein
MIKFCLTPYLDTTWRLDGTGYTTVDHASRITPFQHELLEQLALTDGHRTLLMVRERLTGRRPVDPRLRNACAADYDRARTMVLDWPADFILVETAPATPVRVTAGSAGIAPV